MCINESIDRNIERLNLMFEDCGDVVKRKIHFSANGTMTAYVMYIDGLAYREVIEKNILKNVMILGGGNIRSHAFFGEFRDMLEQKGADSISSADIKEITTLKEAADGILSGDCLFLMDGCTSAIVISTKKWPNRGIGEPETEKVLKGSKEAFTETFRMNTALVRRRIRDTNLKIKQLKLGTRSNTDIAVIYMKDIVRNSVLEKVLEKINAIDIDAILDSGYLEQFLEDNKYSPFPQTQVTERPDKAASAVLEGRIAIIVDNSPFVILLPTTLNMFFQSSEDYYGRFEIMSLLRILRYFAAFAAVGLSGLYIALTVYHPAMIPSELALKMAAARQSIPFPAVVEIMIMDIAFELLREAGIRLPGPIGGTLGIVGGLIMGQAAVEAGLVSPLVVIVVALSGIASFAIPNQDFVSGLRISKFLVILLSSILGLLGFWSAILLIMTHLVSMKSFGVPYMYPFGCSDFSETSDLKDAAVRAPLFKMTNRPFFAESGQRKRMSLPEERGKIR